MGQYPMNGGTPGGKSYEQMDDLGVAPFWTPPLSVSDLILARRIKLIQIVDILFRQIGGGSVLKIREPEVLVILATYVRFSALAHTHIMLGDMKQGHSWIHFFWLYQEHGAFLKWGYP